MQQQKQKKIPVRRCVGCNTQRPKRELVRVVRSPEGEISIDLRGKAPEEMTKEEKKQVISYLDQKGAMLITKSGPKICRYLGISKFTLYNYLDEIHSEQEQKAKP